MKVGIKFQWRSMCIGVHYRHMGLDRTRKVLLIYPVPFVVLKLEWRSL